ncbi:MAG: 4Fe-4S cluster-binding domain-containing protein [Candidatus Gastranaerophilales bacterium]|nr:4Fe-4S cluster-binding domain-containing protein [Candidatus Gastranaerophilales bacterium]
MGIELINNKLHLQYFLYEIVHHCNLNCKGCDHCAPIAEEEYVELKQYKNDLKHFNEINAFAIMGGEPLLHPYINEIVKISRKILKKMFHCHLYKWTRITK